MYRIEKEFAFSAAHHLPHLPPAHPCARPHGHNYRVRAVLEARTLDRRGFVRDYRDLDPVKHFLDAEWDHRDLNTLAPLAPVPTTAEALAAFLYHRFAHALPELVEVQVSETPKTWASYRPEPGEEVAEP